jgi:hypothetical protein
VFLLLSVVYAIDMAALRCLPGCLCITSRLEEYCTEEYCLFYSKPGFLKTWYAYHQRYACHCSMVPGHSSGKKKSKAKEIEFVSSNKCSYIENFIELFLSFAYIK